MRDWRFHSLSTFLIDDEVEGSGGSLLSFAALETPALGDVAAFAEAGDIDFLASEAVDQASDETDAVDNVGSIDLPLESTADDPDQPPDAAPEPTLPIDDPQTIRAARILAERPDVLEAYYQAYYVSGASKHAALWTKLVGGTSAEDYAQFWYDNHGRFEGYNQGPTTAALNISIEKIFEDRPDVLAAYQSAKHGKDWVKEVGGDTPEAYAKYWYAKHGRWEGYAQTDEAAAHSINLDQLIADRPDVVAAYYKDFYGPNNDQKSSAWVDRVGGETLKDYAKYWYTTLGRKAGYAQHGGATDAAPNPDEEAAPPVADPSLDPWNHPALYPDYDGPRPGDPEFTGLAQVGRTLEADALV